MPRDPNTGIYTPPANSWNPAVAGTVMGEADWNSLRSDMATALTQTASTARALYPTTAQVQDGAFLWAGVAGGSANALSLALAPAITAYAAGQVFRFVAGAAANTGAVTLSINGLAAAPVVMKDGATALSAGDIPAGSLCEVLHDGTRFRLLAPEPSLSPVGTVSAFAGASAPPRWLLCTGGTVSRTTYAALFAAIGTTYGAGDGSTTFHLPDLRGRVVAGKDDMGGSAASRVTAAVSGINGATLGAAGGDQRAPQHTHTATSTVSDPGHTHDIANGFMTGGGTVYFGGTGGNMGLELTTRTAATGITVSTSIANAGSGTAQNVQPTMVLNWIIYAGA